MNKTRPAWPWIVAVLMLATVAYPLAWGPWIWLQAEGRIPERLICVDHAFDPLRWLLSVGPDEINAHWLGYLGWWYDHASMPNLVQEPAATP